MYRYGKKTAYRKVAGETFIVVPETRMLYQPTGVGERIWELIGAGLNLEEMARKICDEYKVTFDVAMEDVKVFVEELLKNNLIAHV